MSARTCLSVCVCVYGDGQHWHHQCLLFKRIYLRAPQMLFILPVSTKLKWGILVSPCPSVDRIVSALYLEHYSSDPLYISEGVSRVKFQHSKIWYYLFLQVGHGLTCVAYICQKGLSLDYICQTLTLMTLVCKIASEERVSVSWLLGAMWLTGNSCGVRFPSSAT